MTKDKLDVIFEMQKAFDDSVIQSRGLDVEDKEVWIQRKLLAMFSELSEVLDEVNFKWWKNPKPLQEQKVKEELVDVLHFFVSMCLTMDMTAEELFQMYLEKNSENFARQQGKSDKKGYEVK